MVSCDSFCFLGRHWVFESQFAMAYDILGETRCICHVGQTQALGENGNVTNVKLLRAGNTVYGFVFLPPTRYMFTVVFWKSLIMRRHSALSDISWMHMRAMFEFHFIISRKSADIQNQEGQGNDICKTQVFTRQMQIQWSSKFSQHTSVSILPGSF